MLIQVGRQTWRSEHTNCLYFSLLNVGNKICQQNGSSANEMSASSNYGYQTRCGGCSEVCRGFLRMTSRNWHTGMPCDISYEQRTSAWVVIMLSRPYKSVATRPSSAAIVGWTCWHELIAGSLYAAQRPSDNYAISCRLLWRHFHLYKHHKGFQKIKTNDSLSNERRRIIATLSHSLSVSCDKSNCAYKEINKQLIPWGKAFHESPQSLNSPRNSPLNGSRRLLTAFTRAATGHFNEPNESSLQTTTHFNVHFNIIPSSNAHVFQVIVISSLRYFK